MPHILIIDDDPDETDILMDALASTGLAFTCTSATDGPAALAILQKLVPDYIILDYQMPKMNGLECLEAIKGMEAICAVPVIMYSSSVDGQRISRAMELGAVGYVPKTHDRKVLLALLQPFLSR